VLGWRHEDTTTLWLEYWAKRFPSIESETGQCAESECIACHLMKHAGAKVTRAWSQGVGECGEPSTNMQVANEIRAIKDCNIDPWRGRPTPHEGIEGNNNNIYVK